jgi:hypothetical protein
VEATLLSLLLLLLLLPLLLLVRGARLVRKLLPQTRPVPEPSLLLLLLLLVVVGSTLLLLLLLLPWTPCCFASTSVAAAKNAVCVAWDQAEEYHTCAHMTLLVSMQQCSQLCI